jgi:hypothetical protein
MPHREWGTAHDARCAVRPDTAAHLELEPDQPYRQPYVLVLSNSVGDGLALKGSRRELLDYLQTAHQHVARETSRHAELGEALAQLRELRGERASLTERYGDTGYGMAEIRRLDEAEVDVLNDVAEAAAAVHDDLTPGARDHQQETP